MTITEEDDLTTRITSRSFMKNNKRFPNEFVLPGQGKRWNAESNEMFYQGLRSFGTDFQMMNSHINAPVPQLGTGDPVDDRIDEVLAEVMNKDPERRTPSAAAMRASLLGIIREIDAAAVLVNASSRFVDGSEFGFGAEIGISTQKLHARGPMGLPEMTSTKYVVTGSGQTR